VFHIRELYHSATATVGVSPMILRVAEYSSDTNPISPSGGKIFDIDIGAFLSRGGQGQEKQELLRLIGTLVEERLPT